MTDFRSVTINDALSGLLDQIEQIYAPVQPERDVEPRIRTGVPAVDRLLGGVPTGAVTLIAADQPVHAESLAASIVRDCSYAVAFAASDVLASTRMLLAATARVPYPLLERGILTASDWAKITPACGALAARPLTITTCPTATGILRVARDTASELCVVLTPERLDADVYAAVGALAQAARGTPVAVVALTAARTDDADAVVVAPSRLSGTLELVASDPVDLLRRTTISVDRLSRHAR